jgi:hypothetical protein
MAQGQRPPGQGADFVTQVVSDPNQPANVLLLRGIPGPAVDPGRQRIYLSPDLSAYVEVSNAAIRYRKPVPDDPFGCELFWLDKPLVVPTAGPAASALAGYFAGLTAPAPVAGPMPMAPGGLAQFQPIDTLTYRCPAAGPIPAAALPSMPPGCRQAMPPQAAGPHYYTYPYVSCYYACYTQYCTYYGCYTQNCYTQDLFQCYGSFGLTC